MTARLNARPYFTSFDGADRNASTAMRDSSVTTVQSLYLLNNEFVHGQAAAFADRLMDECSNDEARLQRAFEVAIARPANRRRRWLRPTIFSRKCGIDSNTTTGSED